MTDQHLLSWMRVDRILIKNQLDELIPQIYFWNKIYMFRTVSLSIIRSFNYTHSNGVCQTVHRDKFL